MAIIKAPQYGYHLKRMDYAHHKLDMHTDNSARSEIPDEKTKSMDDFNTVMQKQDSKVKGARGLKITNPKHIKPTNVNANFRVNTARNQPETTLSGNSISMQQELLGINEATAMNLDSSEATKNMMGRAHMVTSIYSGKG